MSFSLAEVKVCSLYTPTSTLTVFVSFLLSICFFAQLNQNGKPFEISLFNWISVHNFKLDFGLLLDQLSLLWLLFVTGIGSLIHLYSIAYMHEDEGFYKFFAYLNFFIFNMLMLVLGANFLMLFFGWEGVGLCSYLLIGFWFKNIAYNNAAKKASGSQRGLLQVFSEEAKRLKEETEKANEQKRIQAEIQAEINRKLDIKKPLNQRSSGF